MGEALAATQYKIQRGLDVPISGACRRETVFDGATRRVGLIGDDYTGMKPRILAAEGDRVGAGAPVMIDKDVPEALIVSPIAGRVTAINRGARRKLVSVEIEADPDAAEPVDFSTIGGQADAGAIAEKLCAAGLWTSLSLIHIRSRPPTEKCCHRPCEPHAQ